MVDRILVPLELTDPEPLSETLVDDLASLEVVLLGHYSLPEQTPARVASEQFGDDAQATLDELAGRFREKGSTVETRLVFGKAREATIDRVADEEGCIAELDPAPTEGVERILVPVPDVAEFSRLPAFVGVLCEQSTTAVTLFHVVEGEEDRERGETIVEKTRDGMVESGFDPDLLGTRLAEGDEHDTEIIRVADEYDAVVMYEAEPRRSDRIFGSLPDRIRNDTGDPVIVVRRDYEPTLRDEDG
jgi:nucleotide-binding universal stress UspA family protein